MAPETRESGKYIVLLKAIDDKKMRYITAKKLFELKPATSFADWKAKIDKGEPLVVMRSDNRGEASRFKDQVATTGAPVEVVEQTTIGGAKIF